MKNLYVIAGVLCSSLLIGGCNASTQKEENRNSSDEVAEQVTEIVNVKDNSEELPEQSANATEASQLSESSKVKKDSEPFDYLESLVLDYDYLKLVVKYPSGSTTIYNKEVSDLDEDDPFYYGGEGPDMTDVKLLKTKISPSGPDYYVVSSMGPSADPSFSIYEEGSFDNPVLRAYATHLFIPGNGNIYASGHTSNYFNTRKKYEFNNGQFVEAKQPFYYVGLKSKTRKPAKIYKSEQLEEVVAFMPKDYSVEVLVQKPGTNLFLVRTDFGLCGWIEISGEDAFGGVELIKGLHFAGD